MAENKEQIVNEILSELSATIANLIRENAILRANLNSLQRESAQDTEGKDSRASF